MKIWCRIRKGEDNRCYREERLDCQKDGKRRMKKIVVAHRELAVAQADYVRALSEIGCALLQFANGESRLHGVPHSDIIMGMMAKVGDCFVRAAECGKEVSLLLGWPREVWELGYYGESSSLSYSTVDKLYGLEKRLYELMKEGKRKQRLYENGLRDREVRRRRGAIEDEGCVANMERSKEAVDMVEKEIEDMSVEIKRLTDEILYPELLKYLDGVMCMWARMHECHIEQAEAIVHQQNLGASSTRQQLPTFNTHLQLTLQLESKVKQWMNCFSTLWNCQRRYISSLTKWVYIRDSFNNRKIYLLCLDLDHAFDMKIHHKGVKVGMKRLLKTTRDIRAQQRKELNQTKKCESVLKKLDKIRKELRFGECKLEAMQMYKDPHSSCVELLKRLVEQKRGKLAALVVKEEMEKIKQRRLISLTRKTSVKSLNLGLCQSIMAIVGFAAQCRDAYMGVYTLVNERQLSAAIGNPVEACDTNSFHTACGDTDSQ